MNNKHQVNAASSQPKIYSEAMLAEDCYEQIAKCAYYKSQKRDFIAGDDWADWYAAEQEVKQARFL
ncbi:MAG: DUF2934 domain-containing protein [Methylococcaceae bacterium]|nr:DUF2934 domain-containing protein [Methylococcaceae bacterium]